MAKTVSRRHFVVKTKPKPARAKPVKAEQEPLRQRVPARSSLRPARVVGRSTENRAAGLLAGLILAASGSVYLVGRQLDLGFGAFQAQETSRAEARVAVDSPAFIATDKRPPPTEESFLATFNSRHVVYASGIAQGNPGEAKRLILPANVSGSCKIANGIADVERCLFRNGARVE